MKTLTAIISILICSVLCAQTNTAYTVFENDMLTANPAKVMEFEKGLAAHNKKFHADGMYSARVYYITSGKNIGKYIWSMGPIPWSAMDDRPSAEGHEEDWNQNVQPYMESDGDRDYWRFHPELSNFPQDFNLKHLFVFIFDIKRFKNMEFMDLVKKVQKVYMEKYPDWPYGIYFNELANKEGKDFAWVDFFDSWGWLNNEGEFPRYFEEVHGSGSFAEFMKSIEETTDSEWHELWTFREDLSGMGPAVQAVERQ